MAGGDEWTQARQDHARDLWLNGQTYGEIAEQLDPFVDQTGPTKKHLYATAGSAKRAILAAIKRHAGDEEGDVEPEALPKNADPATVRSRLDAQWSLLINHYMPMALDGDNEFASSVVARALTQQARLHGVNLRPSSVEREKPGGESTVDELADRRSRRKPSTG